MTRFSDPFARSYDGDVWRGNNYQANPWQNSGPSTEVQSNLLDFDFEPTPSSELLEPEDPLEPNQEEFHSHPAYSPSPPSAPALPPVASYAPPIPHRPPPTLGYSSAPSYIKHSNKISHAHQPQPAQPSSSALRPSTPPRGHLDFIPRISANRCPPPLPQEQQAGSSLCSPPALYGFPPIPQPPYQLATVHRPVPTQHVAPYGLVNQLSAAPAIPVAAEQPQNTPRPFIVYDDEHDGTYIKKYRAKDKLRCGELTKQGKPCDRITSISDLRRHLETHLPRDSALRSKYQCDMCGRTFTRLDALSRHLRTDSITCSIALKILLPSKYIYLTNGKRWGRNSILEPTQHTGKLTVFVASCPVGPLGNRVYQQLP